MGRLRIALAIAADLATLVTMGLFIVGVLAIGGAISAGRIGPTGQNAGGSKARPSPGALSQSVQGRMPFLSGAEHYPPSARIALIEFGDFDCRYCAKFNETILPLLKKEFIDSGQLAFVYREFPLSKRPLSAEASQAALCAQGQGKYWQMQTLLFARPGKLVSDQVMTYAKELDLNVDSFARCLSSGSAVTKTALDRALGERLGVSGTPTFFLGRIVGDEVELKWKLLGGHPIGTFREAIVQIGREESSSK